MQTIVVHVLLVALGLLGAISDALLNVWAKTPTVRWLLASYVAWVLVATLLGIFLRIGYFSFSGAVVVFLLANTAFAVLIDTLWFNAELSKWQLLGLAFAVAAMVCMELNRHEVPPCIRCRLPKTAPISYPLQI